MKTSVAAVARGFLAVFLASCLAGCWPAVLVGGTAAGYYAGNDERDVNQIADDASITAAVKARFLRDKDVSAWDINVDTRYGVVTLNGTVSSSEKEERAIDLTQEVRGVKKIISKLTIVTR
jgi:hyperosmotically inducible protein